VSNDVDAIEERTAVCRPHGRPMAHSRGGGSVLGPGLAKVGADLYSEFRAFLATTIASSPHYEPYLLFLTFT
jgi:hypothetical protein